MLSPVLPLPWPLHQTLLTAAADSQRPAQTGGSLCDRQLLPLGYTQQYHTCSGGSETDFLGMLEGNWISFFVHLSHLCSFLCLLRIISLSLMLFWPESDLFLLHRHSSLVSLLSLKMSCRFSTLSYYYYFFSSCHSLDVPANTCRCVNQDYYKFRYLIFRQTTPSQFVAHFVCSFFLQGGGSVFCITHTNISNHRLKARSSVKKIYHYKKGPYTF